MQIKFMGDYFDIIKKEFKKGNREEVLTNTKLEDDMRDTKRKGIIERLEHSLKKNRKNSKVEGTIIKKYNIRSMDCLPQYSPAEILKLDDQLREKLKDFVSYTDMEIVGRDMSSFVFSNISKENKVKLQVKKIYDLDISKKCKIKGEDYIFLGFLRTFKKVEMGLAINPENKTIKVVDLENKVVKYDMDFTELGGEYIYDLITLIYNKFERSSTNILDYIDWNYFLKDLDLGLSTYIERIRKMKSPY